MRGISSPNDSFAPEKNIEGRGEIEHRVGWRIRGCLQCFADHNHHEIPRIQVLLLERAPVLWWRANRLVRV